VEWSAVGWGGMVAAAAKKAVFLLLAKLSSCIADSSSSSLTALLQDNSLTLQAFLQSPFYSLRPLLGPSSSLNWKLLW
jgi:hypothetical protein